MNARIKIATLSLLAALSVVFAPQVALAQDDALTAAPGSGEVFGEAPASAASGEIVASETTPPQAVGAYSPMAPTKNKGMPTDPNSGEPGAMAKSLTFQDQYSKDGEYALWMHNWFLLPVITAISLFVLGLLLYVVVRYSRRANPEPSRTTHNTWIEVVWTIVPAAILVVIAVPSLTLLARQYETPPEDAVTIKATGYQWYWGYSYPDHGEIEVISNMLSDADAIKNGEPPQLAVDNRMVVPAGVPLRIQTIGADVIHSFAIPSLWFKQDAVPGRLNEKLLTIEEPGVYYGQCSELCGTRHAYMPIAIEALPPEQFAAWVRSQGGTMPGGGTGEEAAAEEEAPVGEVAEVALAD
ncbi:cytochrome C oxidase subunit II [Erythrobacter litoralis]|uniref:Cytochrome c oxidase subunit 2 n=1 Tax=Erythrobacter litoralis TaxID=39960 RepID=A0A074NKZ4_9SPHN|nr:cytochrome c oxidase subunit II [Erythrobacter litoralis]KEO98442.1 cytochrome C oxidase subunit II [Erythrobacter litoralis]